MKQTAIGTIEPNGNGPGKSVQSVFHTLDTVERTAAQVSILRGILDTTHDFLISSKSATEGFEVIRPAAVEEANKTAELAFLQMRNIIDQQARWGHEETDTGREAKAFLEAETKRSTVDCALKEQLMRPFYMLRAQVFRTDSGRFVAVNDSQTIVGFGATPEEAAQAFDQTFVDGPKPETAAAPIAKKNPKRKKK